QRDRVVARDARRDRIGRLAETARRAGVAIRIALADLLSAPFAAGTLDAVLVDSPCSATGTMARHPDARWRVAEGTIARAARRQLALLAAAAPLVKRGGLLIYATCSLEPEEDSEIVNEFLARHPAFARARPGAVPAGHPPAYPVPFPSPLLHGHQVVPRVLGLSLPEASVQIRNAGLQVQDGGSEPHPTAPQGTVIWQDPPPGVSAPVGLRVTLVS